MSWFDQCQGTFTTPFTALAPLALNSGRDFTPTAWDTIISGTTYSSPTLLASGRLFAEPVRVLWQSSDLSNFPSAYATSLAAKMGVEIGDKPSLSTGAKAGIALGAVLGFALIAGAIAVLVLRKRKKAQVPRIPQDVAEMPSHSAGLKRLFRGKWRAEMDGDSQPVEIDSRKVYVVPGPPAELEAPQHELSRSPSVAARQ
jgi:hypothetical protein